MVVKRIFDDATVGEIIEMALSDDTAFATIEALHGLGPNAVKALMRAKLKSGIYRAWRNVFGNFPIAVKSTSNASAADDSRSKHSSRHRHRQQNLGQDL